MGKHRHQKKMEVSSTETWPSDNVSPFPYFSLPGEIRELTMDYILVPGDVYFPLTPPQAPQIFPWLPAPGDEHSDLPRSKSDLPAEFAKHHLLDDIEKTAALVGWANSGCKEPMNIWEEKFAYVGKTFNNVEELSVVFSGIDAIPWELDYGLFDIGLDRLRCEADPGIDFDVLKGREGKDYVRIALRGDRLREERGLLGGNYDPSHWSNRYQPLGLMLEFAQAAARWSFGSWDELQLFPFSMADSDSWVGKRKVVAAS